jgi:hypothetical protein
MGNSTSQKLFRQYQSKPSNRVRDQLWHYYFKSEENFDENEIVDENETAEVEQERDKTAKLFYQQSNEFLSYKQSETFLSDLFDYLRAQDEKRTHPSRSWDDKGVILQHWLRAYGSYPQPERVQKTNALDAEQHSLVMDDGTKRWTWMFILPYFIAILLLVAPF